MGITRAREQLVVCSAEIRRLYGKENYNQVSRFIREIPAEFIQEIRPKAQFSRPSFSSSPSPQLSHRQTEDDTGLFVGQNVSHAKFGSGVILNLEGQGSQSRVQVNFKRAGSKWLMASMANLQSS